MNWKRVWIINFSVVLVLVTADFLVNWITFDAKVHAYLSKHPEVMAEMSAALQQKQQAAALEKSSAAIKANAQALFAAAEDPVIGNPVGDVTVVEFFDYQCPYCKAEAENLTRLVAEDNHVRVVFKQFPVVGGPGSMTAAKAALAAIAQGKYANLHNALMKDKTPERQLTDNQIYALAGTAGLDVDRLKRDMATPDFAMKIAASMTLGRDIGITGTPALVIGGRVINGMVPYDALKGIVADERTHTKTNG